MDTYQSTEIPNAPNAAQTLITTETGQSAHNPECESNHDDLDQTFEVSLFLSVKQPQGTREKWTWKQFEERFSNSHLRSHKEGPLFSMAIYQDGPVHRKKENVVAFSGLIVDCDESHTLDELNAIIQPLEVRAIVGSTFSHGRPDVKNHPNAHAPGERYRVIFPLSSPVLVADYPEVWNRLNSLFGGRIDAACKDPSRAYFLPSHLDKNKIVFKSIFGYSSEVIPSRYI